MLCRWCDPAEAAEKAKRLDCWGAKYNLEACWAEGRTCEDPRAVFKLKCPAMWLNQDSDPVWVKYLNDQYWVKNFLTRNN